MCYSPSQFPRWLTAPFPYSCIAQTLVAMEGMWAANAAVVLKDAMHAMDGQERCCHLLGCDVMLDADGRAWMLEVSVGFGQSLLKS